MNTSSSLQGWSVWRAAAALIVGAAIVAGCGGVGTGGTGGTKPTSAITGKVADGYLVNALVFLDKNGNYQLDPGEPFTTSGLDGVYILNVDPADIGQYPIVAVAAKGQTIDKDTGLSVENSYVLSMPAKAVSGTLGGNFISPISSQVRELLETGIYTTLQQAMDQVGTRIGLPAGTDMLVDYKATANSIMSSNAQKMATLMGSQTAQVLATEGTSVIVDVNRYRGMVGMIFSNLALVNAATGPTAITSIATGMAVSVTAIPLGQPFINMSAAFR